MVRRPKINLMLAATILIVAACPMVAALYFVDRVLDTSLNLGFNTEIVAALDADAENLKTLGRKDPDREAAYRAEFQRVTRLKTVYNSAELLRTSLRRSLLTYFAFGALAALAFAVIAATFLGKRISKSFARTFDELSEHRERVRYLEEMTAWQELAKMLAHEIKNPLTPIEVSMTALSRAATSLPGNALVDQLRATESIVLEELAHLKALVNRFADLARLPKAQRQACEIVELLHNDMRAIERMFDRARCAFAAGSILTPARAMVDATLFRQVLINLARNGLEANPNAIVTFSISISVTSEAIQIVVRNDGVPVPPAVAGKIFEPYFSGKSGKDNMGLGLAIARKILIEHDGELRYEEIDGQPAFSMTLPRAL